MELIGKISTVQVNPITKAASITFEVEDMQQAMSEYDTLANERLRITASKYRKKRTLSMNAYFWVLLDKVAKVLRTDTESLHRRYVFEHGFVWLDENQKAVPIALTEKVNVDKALPGYWKQYGEKHGNLINYLRIKGTSEMTTEEMSIVLNDLIEEAQSLGIQTETPEEVERMKQLEKAAMEHFNR